VVKVGARLVFDKMPEFVAQVIARADLGVEKVARRVQARAMEFVPKKTRTLMRSINVTKPAPLQRVVAPNTPYDLAQEVGFHHRGGGWVSGKFYMKRAAEAERATAARTVADEIRG